MGPRFVTVVGLKKSGKTTVAEGLISELSSRGYRVGSVKTMRHSALTLDAAGTDTRRHAEAGAAVVVALLDQETVSFQRGRVPSTLAGLSRLFPAGTQFVISEGLVDPRGRQTVIACLRTPSELGEVLGVRRVRRGAVIAISGLAGSGPSATGGQIDGLPCYDVRKPRQRRELADLVLRQAGKKQPAPMHSAKGAGSGGAG
jgi:molybdopterin-guanine dinucleotide biosynthesis protein MobB